MHTFKSKTLTVHINSDGSGKARLDLGIAFEPGIYEIPAEELVSLPSLTHEGC